MIFSTSLEPNKSITLPRTQKRHSWQKKKQIPQFKATMRHDRYRAQHQVRYLMRQHHVWLHDLRSWHLRRVLQYSIIHHLPYLLLLLEEESFLLLSSHEFLIRKQMKERDAECPDPFVGNRSTKTPSFLALMAHTNIYTKHNRKPPKTACRIMTERHVSIINKRGMYHNYLPYKKKYMYGSKKEKKEIIIITTCDRLERNC